MKKLDDVFYGKDLMMKGFDVFKEAVKSLKISNDELLKYYNNQEIVQLFKPIPQKKNITFIPISKNDAETKPNIIQNKTFL